MELGELRLFVFDLAGTTIRDDGRVLRAFEAVAAEEGIGVERSWLTARMGWYKTRVFAELLENAGRSVDGAPRLTSRFDDVMLHSWRADPPTPLPGAAEAVRDLHRAGVAVGFTTGFTRQVADVILAEEPFGSGFTPDVVVASDEVSAGRPAPDLILEAMRRVGVRDVRTVGIAGDTPSDLEAGTRAGCRVVIGVGHGTHTLGQLASTPHTALLPDLSGLLAAIEATP